MGSKDDLSLGPRGFTETFPRPSVDAAQGPDARRRVLVVDDEAVVARFFKRALQEYDVRWASSGFEAMSMLRDTSYDAILSDISMPEMDGLQFLDEVRRIDRDVPVVLVTGSPDLETAMKAVEKGALRYLVKPVKVADLREVVTYALRIGDLAKIQREAMTLFRERARAASDRAELDATFSSALRSLWVAFQPIVSWSQGRILAYEALMRTRERLFPHPGAFLEAARSLHRVHELGRRVRAVVARDIALLNETIGVFVNLHPLELDDEELYSESAPLSAHARRVVLEITERESLECLSDATGRIGRLRAMGYRLAVDDLGAGYNGLTSFVQLNPEVVKIDMSLVRGIDESERQRRLMGSILQLCKSMRIEAVTEGVETQDERRVLTELGSDLMQGFLFSAPAEPFSEVRPEVFVPSPASSGEARSPGTRSRGREVGSATAARTDGGDA